ncbi:MAG: alpha-glucosidase [Treponema sp.]|nr:alpha-glucosidase [Treponema sp.]
MEWWKKSVVYQIYPRSFYDSNSDGIGDLRGIIEKLDYLVYLGVDVLWISPFYASPGVDNGYDISDYRAIAPEFGTMADCEELLEKAHEKGLKIMLDLVVNHTSDKHPWFEESRQSLHNNKRNFYFWREGRDNAPPNNWMSLFGGGAWKQDPKTGQYYLHLFSENQPDLNWDNEEVRQEVYDMMHFWLKKGVDGFRMDMISLISKVPELPDGQLMPNGFGMPFPFVNNGPRLHEFLQEMNREVLSKYDLITVGETPGVKPQDASQYSNPDELNMIFQFDHMLLDRVDPGNAYKKPDFIRLKQALSNWQIELHNKAWNSLYWCNHDQPRSVSRFGNDSSREYRENSAKMLAVCLHMMQGTPFIYQGEELGMTNIRFDNINEVKDVEAIHTYNIAINMGVTPKDAMEVQYHKGRDNARTPMQWENTENAGFSKGTPWIKTNPNHSEINVKVQKDDANSVLNFYRRLIEIRKNYPIVTHGNYELIDPEHKELFIYRRCYGEQILLVICNFTDGQVEWEIPKAFLNMKNEPIIENGVIQRKNGLLIIGAYGSVAYLM